MMRSPIALTRLRVCRIFDEAFPLLLEAPLIDTAKIGLYLWK